MPKFSVKIFRPKSEKCKGHVNELILTTEWRHCDESEKYRQLIGQNIFYILSLIECMTHKYSSYCMNPISWYLCKWLFPKFIIQLLMTTKRLPEWSWIYFHIQSQFTVDRVVINALQIALRECIENACLGRAPLEWFILLVNHWMQT